MIGSGVGDSSVILTSRSSGAHLIVAHIEFAVNPAQPQKETGATTPTSTACFRLTNATQDDDLRT